MKKKKFKNLWRAHHVTITSVLWGNFFSNMWVPRDVCSEHPDHLLRFWTSRIWREKKEKENVGLRGERRFQSEPFKNILNGPNVSSKYHVRYTHLAI